MGFFITFEGIEGSGKTTQIKLLACFLESFGYSVVCTREPGGCPVSDKIRTILLDADNQAITPMTELLLYAAARAQHVSEVIIPAIQSGAVVLCDRFTDATVAYQSFGRGLDRSQIDTLAGLACGSLTPDLTLLIDCEPETGIGRARRRIDASSGPREERFELEAMEFHQRVRDGYLSLAAKEPGRFSLIDGSASVEDIASAIADLVQKKLQDNRNVVR